MNRPEPLMLALSVGAPRRAAAAQEAEVLPAHYHRPPEPSTPKKLQQRFNFHARFW